MLKWIGRILYALFVLMVVGFFELFSGGIDGLRRSDYASEYVLTTFDENGNYDAFAGLDYFNAVIGTYYSKNPIGGKIYDSADDTEGVVDPLYQVKIGFYPFISMRKDNTVDIWYDGFIMVLEEYNPDVLYYSIEITAYNTLDPEQKPIDLKPSIYESAAQAEFLNIYLTPEDFVRNQRVPLTTYIYNGYFYTAPGQSTFTGTNEYTIKAISLFAHVENSEEPVFIYRMTAGPNDYAGSPKAQNLDLDLTAEDMNLSKLLGDDLSQDEITTYHIETAHHPVDLSKYNHWYFIVYGAYALLIVVIPYFWFFHKKVMARFKKKPTQTPDQPVDEHPKEEQLFSDVEPKGDNK